MAQWLLVLAAIAAEQGASNSGFTDKATIIRTRPSAPPAVTDPRFHEFQRQISELLKREAQVKDTAARAAAVRAMCDLHGQIVHDSRYATSDVLKEYRSRLWSRLTKIKTELKQQMARNKADKDSLEALAALEAADPLSVAASDSLAASLSLLGQTQGGAGGLLALGGAAGPTDWGPDLVELIERTINPSFWDVNGGPGSIVYYQPLQCLVVRATAEVHGQIGGVVGGLRDAR